VATPEPGAPPDQVSGWSIRFSELLLAVDAADVRRPPLRHRAHHPLRQADAWLDNPTATPSRAGRPGLPGWCWPPTPSSSCRAITGDQWLAVVAAPAAGTTVALSGPPSVSAASFGARFAGHHTETLRPLTRTAQRPPLRTRDAPSGDQEDQQGCLTCDNSPPHRRRQDQRPTQHAHRVKSQAKSRCAGPSWSQIYPRSVEPRKHRPPRSGTWSPGPRDGWRCPGSRLRP
jgi:hypothetical protein